MRVFMLGWAFPPFISGGLGSACYGLTRALSDSGTDVTFVLPRVASLPFGGRRSVNAGTGGAGSVTSPPHDGGSSHGHDSATEFRLNEFEHVTFKAIATNLLGPYQRPDAWCPDPGTGGVTRADGASTTAARGQGLSGGGFVHAPLGTARPASARANSAAGTLAEPARAEFRHHPEVGPEGVGVPGASADLFAEIARYAEAVERVAREGGYAFDVVHAHDWMTFAAGARVAKASGRPLVVHVHSTEHDRSAADAGGTPDPRIVEHERSGLESADRVIAVSHFTKAVLVRHYGIEEGKIDVVYNAVASGAKIGGGGRFDAPSDTYGTFEGSGESSRPEDRSAKATRFHPSGNFDPQTNRAGGDEADLRATSAREASETADGSPGRSATPDDAWNVPPGARLVVFVGRLTAQKGPSHFLDAARRVADATDGVYFVIAGDGELMTPLVHRAAELGLSQRVLFTGFLSCGDVERLLASADCFVMPSVSEPFGLAALEAASHRVPTIVSRTSGVSEVLPEAILVDFWDHEHMAERILGTLTRPDIARRRRDADRIEVHAMTWPAAAAETLGVYARAGAG